MNSSSLVIRRGEETNIYSLESSGGEIMQEDVYLKTQYLRSLVTGAADVFELPNSPT